MGIAMKPLKVCLVSPLPPPYGGISHWTQMVTAYSEHYTGVSMRVLDTATRWRAVDDLASWKRIVFGGFQLLRDMFRVFACAVSWRPDVIHLTTSGQLGLVRDLSILFVGRLFRIPIVYHIRFGRLPELSVIRGIEWRVFAFIARYSSCVIAIDLLTFNSISKYLPRVNVELVPNCFDPADFSNSCGPPASDAIRTVVFVGWVIPTKGISELMRAWRIVRNDCWRLVVVGPGDSDYVSEMRQISESDDVIFAGGVSHRDALEIMRSADVFVLPSYTEGFPNVVIEAMALGLPIIATSVGAIPEMIGDGRGVLVPPKDIDLLSKALTGLFSDEALRLRLGALARKKAYAEYSINSVYSRYVGIWRVVSGITSQ